MISGLGTGPVDTAESIVINANGAYVIPGLIDSHVHLYHATGLKRRYTDDFDRLYNEFMRQQPRSFLYFGFTTVIELNADAATNARFEGTPEHPRLFHCGQGIVLSDGFMALDLDGEAVSEAYPGYLVDHHANGLIPSGADAKEHSPNASVEFVRRHGGRCIKLYYEEALWWPGGAPEFQLPSLAIVRDVVAAAHSHRMPVVFHATTPNGHRFATNSGVDILAHGMWEWPGQALDATNPSPDYAQLAKDIARNGIWLQPTMTTIRNSASLFDTEFLNDPEWSHVVTENYLQYLKSDAQEQREDFLRRFASELSDGFAVDDLPALITGFNSRYEALIGGMYLDGAKLIFGTDTAVGGFGWAAPPGLAGYWEIQAWDRTGIPLRKLFESLTVKNAQAFGLENEIGTIEVGKRADLLILKANPLENVTAYNTIESVILGGKVIKRSSLSARELREFGAGH